MPKRSDDEKTYVIAVRVIVTARELRVLGLAGGPPGGASKRDRLKRFRAWALTLINRARWADVSGEARIAQERAARRQLELERLVDNLRDHARDAADRGVARTYRAAARRLERLL